MGDRTDAARKGKRRLRPTNSQLIREAFRHIIMFHVKGTSPGGGAMSRASLLPRIAWCGTIVTVLSAGWAGAETLRVTAVSPAPESVVTASPASVAVTFNQNVDPATVTASTSRLVGRGPDGVFGTADDRTIAPVGVTVVGGMQVVLDLTDITMPDDYYQITLAGSVQDGDDSTLVGYWKLDEESGITALDSSGHGKHGQLEGPTRVTNGRFGNALYFNGLQDRVNIDAGDIQPPWTAALWVNREDSLSDDARLTDDSINPAGSSLRLEQYSYTNKVGITRYTGGNPAFDYTAPIGSWVHLTFLGTATETHLYANGAYAGTIALSIPLSVGKLGSHGGNSMKGILDDVRMYNRALTPQEIQYLGTLGYLPGGFKNVDGDALDGEYTGAFPSGDGTVGGDFVSTFMVNAATPSVISTAPANGSLSVDLYMPVSVTFSESMDQASVEASFSVVPAVAGAFSWSGSTVVFTPFSALSESMTYTVTIGVGAEDIAGTALAAPYAFSFTTGTAAAASLPLPVGPVTSLLYFGATASDRITGYPTSGQSILWDDFTHAGLAPEYAQQPSPGQAVTLAVTTTQTPMVWTALTDADGLWCNGIGDQYVAYAALYVLAPTARSTRLDFTYDDRLRVWLDGGADAIFAPTTSGLFAGSAQVTLSAGWHCFVFKLYDAGSADYFSVQFKHPDGTDMTDLRYALSDPMPPVVKEIVPAADATDVPAWSDVIVTFAEPMDTSVIPETVAVLSGGTADGTWAWTDPRRLVWTPSASLEPATAYTMSLTRANAKDITGNTLSGTDTFTFTTAALAAPAPVVVSVLPDRAVTGASLADVALAGSGFARGGGIHPPGAVPFQGHYYQFVHVHTPPDVAETESEALGGHLAVISSAEEDAFVWRLGGYINFYFGLTDQAVEGVFVWVNGEPIVYTNWGPGEPSDWGGEDWAAYWWGFQWNDNVGDRPYVREFDVQTAPSVRLVKTGQPDRVATRVRFVDAGHLLFNVDLVGAAPGAWDVVVTNPDGQIAVLPSGLTVDPLLQITGLAPASGSVLGPVPASIVATFNQDLDPVSVTTSTFRLVGRGPDEFLGTADDVLITPVSVAVVGGNQAVMDLTGVMVSDDIYGVQLVATAPATGDPSLIAYWRFDEGAGTVAQDDSGTGKTGTLVNSPVWTMAGRFNGALRFDSPTDYVSLGLSNVSSPWTASFWVKPEGSTGMADLLYSSTWALRLEQYLTRKIGFTRFTVTDWSFADAAPLGTWIHLAFVSSPAGTSLYINGVFQETIGVVSQLPLAAIGSAASSLIGVLDEVRLYNRALTAGEIQALALSGGGIAAAGGATLDGEFGGTFPSGDGRPGGDFTATYAIGANAPTVVVVSPTDGAVSVDRMMPVSVTFSESMDKASAEAAFSIAPPATGAFSWWGHTLTFTPSAPYPESTVCAVTIAASAQDAGGMLMAAPHVFTFTTGTTATSSLPLPPGLVKRLLHLGSQESDRISGYPSPSREILGDLFLHAGLGPEYAQRPGPGQAAHFPVTTTEIPMVWTPLTDADADGIWAENVGDYYIMYWALYVLAPTTRQTRLVLTHDDELRVWMDGNPSPLYTSFAYGGGSVEFPLTAGWHVYLFKLREKTGNDSFSVRFSNPDLTDMTDLRYALEDPLPPDVETVFPADGAAGVPIWSDVLVTFREPMDTGTSPATVASLSGGTADGSWTWADPRTLVWTPAANLDPSTIYTLAISPSDATDLAGHPLTGTHSFSFTTAPLQPAPSLVSVTPPCGVSGYTLSGAILDGSGFLEGGVLHPVGATPFQGHYYLLSAVCASWSDAKADCEAMGGHLAVVTSPEENDFVYDHGASLANWIGASDLDVEGTFAWVTGEPFAFTNWRVNQPDNYEDNEDAVSFFQDPTWNDRSMTDLRAAVCEFESRTPPAIRLRRAGQPDRVATGVRWTDAGHLTFDVDLAGAILGAWDVTVTNPDGQSATLAGAFTVEVLLKVTGLTPAPGSIVVGTPVALTVDFNKAVDPSTVTASTFRLLRHGPDGVFGTADDVVVPPALVTASGAQAVFQLSAAPIPDDVYGIQILAGAGQVADSSGVSLDGEYLGVFPTGNDAPGGDFLATFIFRNDADRDGMPDYWENLYGLDPDNPADAGWDLDNDGFTNLTEYRNGTNPADPPPSGGHHSRCGSIGIDLMLPLVFLWLWRKRRDRESICSPEERMGP